MLHLKSVLLAMFAASVPLSEASACPTWYTLTNGSTADADQVMSNFNNVLQCPDFTGSVGIRTSAPTEALTVNGEIAGGFGATTTAGVLDWNDTTNARSGNGHTLLLGSAADGPGPADYFHPFSFEYGSHDGTGNLTQLAIPYAFSGSINDGIYMRGRYGGAWTGWVRLISSTIAGNVGIGTATPAYTLDVNGTAAIRSTAYMYNNPLYAYESSTGKYLGFSTVGGVGRLGMTDTSSLALQTAGGSVGIGTASPSYTLHVNGSVAGTSAYNNLSDRRLKKNIVPIAGALAIIEQLQGVRFDWRKPDERTVGKHLNLPVNDPQVGFIAQEVQKVLPQAVTVADSGDHLMSTQESKVVPVLVEAVKQLATLNKAQAVRIQKLEERLSALERKSLKRTAEIGTR